jgi:ketosteroid isomerase-like protein
MKSLEELSDRIEIQDLQVAYSHAIDFKDFDALDDVFTPDAHIDYTVFGGPKGSYPEIKKYLSETMPMFSGYYHMQATSKVTIDGDTATAVTPCYNPMVLPLGEGKEQVFTCGLWYHDTYVRTPQGWRISKRVEEKTFVDNMPAGLA